LIFGVRTLHIPIEIGDHPWRTVGDSQFRAFYDLVAFVEDPVATVTSRGRCQDRPHLPRVGRRASVREDVARFLWAAYRIAAFRWRARMPSVALLLCRHGLLASARFDSAAPSSSCRHGNAELSSRRPPSDSEGPRSVGESPRSSSMSWRGSPTASAPQPR